MFGQHGAFAGGHSPQLVATAAARRQRRLVFGLVAALMAGALGLVPTNGAVAVPTPANFVPELVTAQGFSDGVATEVGLSPNDITWDAVRGQLLVADCEVVRLVDPAANTSTVIAIAADLANPTGVATFVGRAQEVAVRGDGTVLLGLGDACGSSGIYWDRVARLAPSGPAVPLSGSGVESPASGVVAGEVDWSGLTDLGTSDDGRIFVTYGATFAFSFVEGGALAQVLGGGSQVPADGLPAADMETFQVPRDWLVLPDGTLVFSATDGTSPSLFAVDGSGVLDEIATGLPFGEVSFAVGPGGDIWMSGLRQPSFPPTMLVARLHRATGVLEELDEEPWNGFAYWMTVAVDPSGTAYTLRPSAVDPYRSGELLAVSETSPFTVVAGLSDRWQGEGMQVDRQYFGLEDQLQLAGRPDVGGGSDGQLRVSGSRLAVVDVATGVTSTSPFDASVYWIGQRLDGDEVALVDAGNFEYSLVSRDAGTGATTLLLPTPFLGQELVDVGPDGTVYVADVYPANELIRIAPDNSVTREPLATGVFSGGTIWATSSGLYTWMPDGLSRRNAGGWDPVADCATGAEQFTPRVALQDGRFLGTVELQDPDTYEITMVGWCRVDPSSGSSELLPDPVVLPLPVNAHQHTDGAVYFGAADPVTERPGVYRMRVTPLNTFDLSVTAAGTGNGTVTSTPAGIDCGATCSASFDADTLVTLTAAADGISTFMGWSANCTVVAGTCQVTLSAATAVTATFTRTQYLLTVSKTGTGNGTVTSTPAGIDCGATCWASFDAATLVTLTATAAIGSAFSGWSEPSCSGASTCLVTMSAVTSVTASFDRPTSSNATAIAAGAHHTCAVRNGAAFCWGYNSDGQLGDGTTNTRPGAAAVVGLGSGVTAIAGGFSHTCAVQNGAAKCWGSNSKGQLGDGTTTTRLTPVTVTGLGSGVTAIAAGYYHTCAIQNGAAKCWGYNRSLQLGNGDGGHVDAWTPVGVVGLDSGVTAIAASGYQSCAIQNGAAKCWGQAVGATNGLGSGVTAIGAGFSHTCAIQSGAVSCWGGNERGQLGDGSVVDRFTPVGVSGLGSGATALAVNESSSCAIQGGAAKCWGDNAYGQLGDGTTTTRLTPVGVSGLDSDVTAIAAGRYHTCAIQTFVVKCWGYNGQGQLGVGWWITNRSSTPVASLNLGFNRTTSGVVSGGGTGPVTSGVAAGDHPLSTSVTATGAGGAVSIIEAPADPSAGLAGYGFFGYQATITAPAGTVDQPLVLTFGIDASIIPPGLSAADVAVIRNGVAVAACTNPAVVRALPSPCLASAAGSSATGMTFTIYTVTASVWQFAVPDSTAPTITFNGATSYTVDQTVLIGCVADDMSGIASMTCPLELGAPAYTFPLGTNSVTASATDTAGNTGTTSVTFTVQVTPNSLCALTTQFVRGSTKYFALNDRGRKHIDAPLKAICRDLAKVKPDMHQRRKSELMIAVYKVSVWSLTADGWLTGAQGKILRELADAL